MERASTVKHSAPTPATELFLTDLDAGDWAGALGVLDEHWTEVWYGFDPADLRRLLAQAPPQLLATLRNASYIARVAGHGTPEDLMEEVPRPGPRSTPDAVAHYVADLRLRGRPVEALSYIRRVQDRFRATRGQLVDSSGGEVALWLVQAANTALLAGDAATARGLLLAAKTTHRPERFPFIRRDAIAKLALTEAVAGQMSAAADWNQRAREVPRSASWVEALSDDVIWLTDYLCAVDALHPRAEELRLERPSPLTHLEFWSVALAAHVRHLILTDRTSQAAALCDAVEAAGLPLPGSDGPLATALLDARAACLPDGNRQGPRPAPASAEQVLAQAVALLTTGQFQAVLDLAGTDLPPTADGRPALALRLLEIQAGTALGHPEVGRHLLLTTLQEILDRGVLSVLRHLTDESLTAVADTETGARVAELVRRHDLPVLEVAQVLQSPLTEAELDVLRLLRQGLTRAEVAQRLFLSLNTVKTQLASAYRKLGVARRGDAMAQLARLGL